MKVKSAQTNVNRAEAAMLRKLRKEPQVETQRCARPAASVLIPTLRRFDYLKEAVASALDQAESNIEVVVSQDSGPGGIDPVIANWAAEASRQNARIRYAASARPLGLAGNWNAAVAAATGEYVLIIGDDDRLHPEGIGSLLAAASHCQADIAFGNHYLIDERGARLVEASEQWTRQYKRDRLKPGLLPDPESAIWSNSVPICAALIRRELAKRLKFDESLNTPEIEFFLRAVRAGARFSFTSEFAAEYRIHPQSATSSGLWLDRLLAVLEPLEVRPELEPLKAEFLSGCALGSAKRFLLEGNCRQARAVANSRYFPRREKSGRLVRACAALPGFMGCNLFRLLMSLRRRNTQG